MRLEYGLTLQQQQRLVMTQELRQALTVLQLPVVDLERFIQQQLLENPVLEVREEAELLAPPEQPWLRAWEAEYDWDLLPPVRDEEEEETPRTQPAPAPTLAEHLHDQLRLLALSREERRAAAFLIDSLDDNGYLTISLEEAARAANVPVAVMERALRIVQSLEPAGVGARSLQECLLLQWEALGMENPLVPVLIRRYLDDLAAGRLSRIAADLQVTPAEVQAAADLLRHLDPKPGRRFGREGVRYLVPDVTVERVGDQFVVLVNDGMLPRLRISPSYRRLLRNPDARPFLERKVQAALWLIRAIEQRRRTLYRVTEAIVRQQQGFFRHGPRYLRPLTLREVAGEIGMHESTVSRAVAGKYIQTPHGLFPLKFFFSSGVEGMDGALSAEAVKRMIRDLVAAEDPRRPLSDQALTEALVRMGVRISRRTVAKYREEAGIPPSARRRRYG
ncbi:MAG: RNA polymerase factor sigma-54 [Firmicutes bacterium]|nr:RNA polymerase factor sigma-54 [Bacillota bacterium]